MKLPINIQIDGGKIVRLAETPNGAVEIELDRLQGLVEAKTKDRVANITTLIPKDRRQILADFFKV